MTGINCRLTYDLDKSHFALKVTVAPAVRTLMAKYLNTGSVRFTVRNFCRGLNKDEDSLAPQWHSSDYYNGRCNIKEPLPYLNNMLCRCTGRSVEDVWGHEVFPSDYTRVILCSSFSEKIFYFNKRESATRVMDNLDVVLYELTSMQTNLEPIDASFTYEYKIGLRGMQEIPQLALGQELPVPNNIIELFTTMGY